MFIVEILHFNKDGMCNVCMLQMSEYRGTGRGSRPRVVLQTMKMPEIL